MAREMRSFFNSPLDIVGWIMTLFIGLFFIKEGVGFSSFYTIGLIGALVVIPITMILLFVPKFSKVFPLRFGRTEFQNSTHYSIMFLIFVVMRGLNIVSEKFFPAQSILQDQVWQAFAITTTPVANTIIVGWLAPFVEEALFAIAAPMLGALLVFAFLTRKGKAVGTARIFSVIIGVAISAILFAAFHPAGLQGPAFVFRIIMSSLVLSGVLFWSGGLGAHQANNLIFLGAATIAAGFTGLSGLVLVAMFAYILLRFGFFFVGLSRVLTGRMRLGDLLGTN